MNNKIQDKLKDFEAQPPARVWDRIDAALEEGTGLLGSRLAAYEQMPPAGAWDRLSAALPNGAEAKLVQLPKRRYWKIAAAAAVLLLLAGAAFFYDRGSVAGNQSSLAVKSTLPLAPATPAQTTLTISDQPEETDVAQPAAEKPQESARSRAARAWGAQQAAALSSLVIMDGFLPKTASRSNVIQFSEPSEKYMVYMSEDGHAARLSKKLYDNIACAPQDLSCKQRIRQLQAKVASAAVTPDFAGVLEIVNNLQENQ